MLRILLHDEYFYGSRDYCITNVLFGNKLYIENQMFYLYTWFESSK